MKKVLSIGDIRGRDLWMFYTHENPYDFKKWKESVENGIPADCEFWNEMPYRKYDKIIFVGDYCDSFDLDNEIILENLKNIVFFKKALPDKVVLLLGNHDIQYLEYNQVCTGWRSEMGIDLMPLLNDKECDYKIAHQEIGEDGKIWVWSHAGITNPWLEQVKKEVFNEKYRLYEITKDYKESNLADFVNMLWEIRNPRVFNVDHESGGFEKWAGPIWVRTRILNENPIPSINQIIGHTPQKRIYRHELEGFSHYYIDCPWDDQKNVLELTI